jgi:hypothetical protein
MENLVVNKNQTGMGHDVSNCVSISTRFKFQPFCRSLDKEPEDAWLQLLLEIDGVIEVSVYDHAGLYDVFIKKATAFTWEEVEPKILEILSERHRWYREGRE